ncbi:MAG: alpha/beta hydrolase [Mycobacterium sp.]|nr:alpha/beta hydrolase [Mycobacterium sp.]
MTDFVLIHGTTQGPTGWDHISDILVSHGDAVHAVQLDDSPSMSTFEYAHAVASQLPQACLDPVVVAHSGSGLLLPDVARRLHARHQVWLAAMIPSPSGQPLAEELGSSAHAIVNPEWIGQDPTQDPAAAMYFLFHDCRWPRARWALDTLRRFLPEHAYTQPIALASEIPSTYVLCSGDRTLQPEWSHNAAIERLGIEPITIDAGHCPHVSSPDVVAEILLTAAA